MENASKALLIAGGILITILILTIGVYLVGNLSKASDSYVQTLDTNEVRKYNSNFEIYAGRNDITIQEIITAIGVVQQTGRNTEVYVKNDSLIGNSNITTMSESKKTELLTQRIAKEVLDTNNNPKTTNTYRCSFNNSDEQLSYDNSSGIISKIVFYKNT